MKVPPAIHQFTKSIDKNKAIALFKLLHQHKPEDHKQKKKRLLAAAAAKVKGEQAPATEKPRVVKYGLKHITSLVEKKKAKLVVIAHDVEPVELVIWLPALCRRMGVPYCIVKGKARLGQVVGKKNATALAFVNVKSEHQKEFSDLVAVAREQYNDKYEDIRRQWGGGKLGLKAEHEKKKKAEQIARERLRSKTAEK